MKKFIWIYATFATGIYIPYSWFVPNQKSCSDSKIQLLLKIVALLLNYDGG